MKFKLGEKAKVCVCTVSVTQNCQKHTSVNLKLIIIIYIYTFKTIYQHNDTTCHGSLCLGELFSCEILSLKDLSGSIFDLQVQHWSEGSQTQSQRRHTSSSCQRLHFKSCNDVCSLPMELVEPPLPPPFVPRVSN